MIEKIKLLRSFVLLFFIVGFHFGAWAQSAEVLVKGDITNPYKIDANNSSALKRITVSAVTGHDGKTHTYSGFSLYEIITKAGAIPNGQLRGKLMAKYVLISAADNYKVVIAIPEFDPAFTDRQIILADQEDGRALPATAGAYRLIVSGDKKPARSVRQVKVITIQTAE